MAKIPKSLKLHGFWLVLLFFLSTALPWVSPVKTADISLSNISSAIASLDSGDSGQIRVSEISHWQDSELGTILTCSEAFLDSGTNETKLALGGYKIVNGTQFAQVRTINVSQDGIGVPHAEFLFNESISYITQVETIQTMSAGHSVIAGGILETGSVEGYFLLVLKAENNALAIANTSASWLLITPNRMLRNFLVFETNEGNYSIITAETEIGETYPVFLRIYDLGSSHASLALKSETSLPAAVPIALAKNPFAAPSIIDLIAAARTHDEPGNLSFFRINNSSGVFSSNSLGNFSQSVSQIFPTQFMVSQSFTNSSNPVVLLGEAFNESQNAAFLLQMTLGSDYTITKDYFTIYEQKDTIFTSSAGILLDIDGNGLDEILWQSKLTPQGSESVGMLWVMEMENQPVHSANHTLRSAIAQDLSPKDLVLINEGRLLLSVGFTSSGTIRHGQITMLALQPIVMEVEMNKALWTFEETLTANLSCNWWQGQPIGALEIDIALTGPTQQVYFKSTTLTNDHGEARLQLDLSNVSAPGSYNLSVTGSARGWEGAGACSLWIDWTNELDVSKSIADSYDGRIEGNIKIINTLSRNETFYVSIHDPRGQLRHFHDHRSLTYIEDMQGVFLIRPLGWNDTSIILDSNEEVKLFFDADSEVGQRIHLELFINGTLFSQAFSFTVISKEIWLSPTFQINALIFLLFIILLIALLAYLGKKQVETKHFLESLPQDKPIDISDAITRYGRPQEWMRRKIPRRIPGYFSLDDSDKFLPERYLATKTRELIELESVKSIQELAEQLNLDQEASRVLLAALHREVIEQDNRMLQERIRVILSALTDFKTLAKTDTKLKGLALGPLASPEGPQAQKAKVTTCSFCGKMLENAKKCQSCGNPVLRCSICRLSVAFGENTATCPECGSIFHQGHLEEWLKIKGNCPVCNHAF